MRVLITESKPQTSETALAARPTHASIDPDEILTGEDLDRVLFFATKFYETQGSAVKQHFFEAWEEHVVGRKVSAWRAREYTPCCVLHPHGNQRLALDSAGLVAKE